MYDIRSVIHIYSQYIRTSTIHMFLCIFVRTFALMHIQPRTYYMLRLYHTITDPKFVKKLHLNYSHHNNLPSYMPPIGMGPICNGTHALFFFLFCFYFYSLQNRFFCTIFSVWHLGTITYSLLFMFDGIFTLNDCNLTHKETKIGFCLTKIYSGFERKVCENSSLVIR